MDWFVFVGLLGLVAVLAGELVLWRALAALLARASTEGVLSHQLVGAEEELAALRATATAALVGERVVANLADGTSIRGVLTTDTPAVLVLEHADYLAGQQPEAFTGRAVLPRPHVLWLQHLGAD